MLLIYFIFKNLSGGFSKKDKGIKMSKQYPECPLYNHVNCREIDNRKVCAIVREDNICLKKLHKNVKKAKE